MKPHIVVALAATVTFGNVVRTTAATAEESAPKGGAAAVDPPKIPDTYAEKTKLTFDVVQQALQTYRKHCACYPPTKPGLDSLAYAPEHGCKEWRGPYVEIKSLADSLGTKLGYRGDCKTFELQAAGLDKTHGTKDDLYYPEPK
jgi:hypothetical protein